MCTRFVWSSGGDPGVGDVLVGRSMDWYQDTHTVLAARPRGADRESAPGDPGSFSWVSKYGSVVALMYGKIAVDGINEVGFQASGLYLAESDYGERDPERPPLALYYTIQYLLDNFATVSEAVKWIKQSNVQIIPLDIGGKPGTGHLALADPSGDSAIIEFIDGKTSIHHGKQYNVMANSPYYHEQLELAKRFRGLGGDEPLPGGTDSPDRFARAVFYTERLPETEDLREAVASAFSVIRNASAPFGTADPARPNISTTRWRTVTDCTNRRLFFESTTNPNVVWINLDQLEFAPGPERIVDLDSNPEFVGNVTGEF